VVPLAAAAVALAAFLATRPVEAAEGGPDLSFFRERIEPVLQSVCAQCHAAPGKASFSLVVRPGGALSDADTQKNFETVLKLLDPGKPEKSKFLLKPLAEKDGGVKHGGGDRIYKDTPAYKTWVDFIDGVKGSGKKPAPSAAPSKPAA